MLLARHSSLGYAAPGSGELDRLAALFVASVARSAPAQVYGFPGAVLISVNEEVVHGVPGRRERGVRLRELRDVGAGSCRRLRREAI